MHALAGPFGKEVTMSDCCKAVAIGMAVLIALVLFAPYLPGLLALICALLFIITFARLFFPD